MNKYLTKNIVISVTIILAIFANIIALYFYQSDNLLAPAFIIFEQIIFQILMVNETSKLIKNISYDKLFSLFQIANIFLLLNNVAYFIIFYVIQLSKAEAVFGLESLVYSIPFTLWSIFALYFWVRIFIKYIINESKSYGLLFYILVYGSIMSAVFFYTLMSKESHSSFILAHQISEFCELFLFNIVIIMLICSRRKGIYFLGFSTIIFIAGDLWVKYFLLYASDNPLTHVYGDALWLIGIVVGFLSLYKIRKTKDYDIKTWFRGMNSIQSQIGFWTFNVYLVSFFTFFLAEYFIFGFDRNFTFYLPLFLAICPLVAASSSILLSTRISFPIKNIIENIALWEKSEPNTLKKDFKIEEFVILQRFITDAFKTKEDKIQSQKKLEEISAQVAHDIRSPLTALQVLTEQKLSELEESKRILLRDAVYQIHDIVNNLDHDSFQKEATATQIAILLEHVISERRTTFSDKSVVINYNFNIEAYSYFVHAIPPDIKRVITNIINNAAESTKYINCIIDIDLFKNDDNIIIKITDNGCGMDNDAINSIFSRGFTTKSNGKGLGLFHAHETIHQLGGTLNVQSELNKGTSVIISLPSYSRPDWFISELNIQPNSVVICVDDSISIWNAWQERFRALNEKSIILRYCNDKQSLLRELGQEESRPCTYLVDYEFSGQSYTGIDLIKQILSFKKENDQVVLVTSRTGEELQKFCLENSISMISKAYTLKILIRVGYE